MFSEALYWCSAKIPATQGFEGQGKTCWGCRTLQHAPKNSNNPNHSFWYLITHKKSAFTFEAWGKLDTFYLDVCSLDDFSYMQVLKINPLEARQFTVLQYTNLKKIITQITFFNLVLISNCANVKLSTFTRISISVKYCNYLQLPQAGSVFFSWHSRCFHWFPSLD